MSPNWICTSNRLPWRPCSPDPRFALVAPERLRLEMWRILAAPQAVPALMCLLRRRRAGAVRAGVRGGPAGLAFAHAAAQQLLAGFAGTSAPNASLLSEAVEQGLDRQTLLLWHHGMRHIARSCRWRWPQLALQPRCHPAPGGPGQRLSRAWAELPALPQRPRVIAQWALQYGPDPVDLLIALALQSQGDPVTAITRCPGTWNCWTNARTCASSPPAG